MSSNLEYEVFESSDPECGLGYYLVAKPWVSWYSSYVNLVHPPPTTSHTRDDETRRIDGSVI